MAERNWIYTEYEGPGNEYILKESADTDSPKGAVPYTSTIGAAIDAVACGDNSRTPIGVRILDNNLLGRTTGIISSLTPATVRDDILNVEDGAAATQGNNIIADEAATQTYNFYVDTTGSPIANRMNFKALRPSVSGGATSRMKVSTVGDAVELDTLEVPHTLQIYGDSNISSLYAIPIIRASQRMRLIDLTVSPKFDSPVDGQERFTFGIYRNTVISYNAGDDPDSRLELLVNAATYANGVKDQTEEWTTGKGYIDKTDGRWLAGDYDNQTGDWQNAILNSGEYLIFRVIGKYNTEGGGSGSGTMAYLNVAFKFGIV